MSEKSFIVTLKESADPEKFKKSVSSLGGSISHEFSLIKGFTVKLPESLHIDSLTKKHESDIATVEEDSKVHTQ